MTFPRRLAPLAVAVLGGGIAALATPPTDLYPMFIVGMAVLFAVSAEAPTFWRAFGRAAMWATVGGMVGMRFVPSVIQRFTPLGVALSLLALVLLAAAQSLIWAIGASVAWVLFRRARVLFELAFATGVFVTLSLPSIFAWSPAGLFSPWPAFVQLADVIGERGVSFVFAIAAALLARAVLFALGAAPGERPAWPLRFAVTRPVLHALAGAIGLFAVVGLYGLVRMRTIAAGEDLRTVRVGLVDQAVAPLARWESKNHPTILRTLRELTRKAEADGAELTIWPEAAYPYVLAHGTTRAPDGPRGPLGSGVKGPLLVGLITKGETVEVTPGEFERNSYNSATLIAPDGAMQIPADKLQLLWFGETVPLGDQLPFLRRAFQRSGGLVPGTEPRALRFDGTGGEVTIGVLNCYEDTLSDVGRRVVRALEPGLLVNVTNDAWFYDTAESELHARLGALRAVEHRRDLVRAVNLGVNTWVDARGVVRARYDGTAPHVLMATPAIRTTPITFFARFGDAPFGTLAVAVMGAMALRARKRGAVEPRVIPPS